MDLPILLELTLWVLAVASTITVLQRMLDGPQADALAVPDA